MMVKYEKQIELLIKLFSSKRWLRQDFKLILDGALSQSDIESKGASQSESDLQVSAQNLVIAIPLFITVDFSRISC